MTTDNAKTRFSQFADSYVTSNVHSRGPDVEQMIQLIQPQPDWLTLDMATGGGHTARFFAPHVGRMVAGDVGVAMLWAARGNMETLGVTNVTYAASDGERMAFASNTFDLITCRYAPHHFPNVFSFFQEVARVLKPGGVFGLIEHLLPEDKRAAEYIETIEILRDPSHVSAYDEYGWRGLFLDAGLTVEHSVVISRVENFNEWVDRQQHPSEIKDRLEILLLQAPEAAAAWIKPTCIGTPDASIDHVTVIMVGRRPIA